MKPVERIRFILKVMKNEYYRKLLTNINIKVHKLTPKRLPRLSLRPNEQSTSTNCRNEMMSTPPSLDPRPVDFKNWFANRKRTVVPHEEKHECQFKSAKVDKQIEYSHWQSDNVEDEFKLFIVVFVANLFSTIQYRHIDIAEDNLRVKRI